MRLEGKIALVTGGGSGIGRGIVHRFAAEGAAVAVLDRNAQNAEETVRIVAPTGADLLFVPADVSQGRQVQAAVAAVHQRWGRIDVLVNNAGIYLLGRDLPVTEMDEDVWDQVLAVNLKSVFLCCKYAIPVMPGGGSIINVASIGALLGTDPTHAYVAAKGGIVSLTRAIALHYAAQRIRANAILPGRVDTPLVQGVYRAPEEKEAFAHAHPLGRYGTPEDIAGLALYLASDEAGWVTGSSYAIDGGYMTR